MPYRIYYPILFYSLAQAPLYATVGKRAASTFYGAARIQTCDLQLRKRTLLQLRYRGGYYILTPHRRQSKTLFTIDKRGSNIASIAICLQQRQMTIENSVSNESDMRSSIVLTFSIAAYPRCDICLELLHEQ